MSEIKYCFCPNESCKDYGIKDQGNISIRGKYGKDNKKVLLYCKTCGKRFATTRTTAFFGFNLHDEQIQQIIHLAAKGLGVRATARFLNINKNTVNRVILRAGEHCEFVLKNLLHSLKLKEAQLDELLAFVKKRELLTTKSAENKSEQSLKKPQG